MHTKKWEEGDTCSNTSICLEKKSHLSHKCKATNCSNDKCMDLYMQVTRAYMYKIENTCNSDWLVQQFNENNPYSPQLYTTCGPIYIYKLHYHSKKNYTLSIPV
jgi:hypothetical protein